MQNAYETEQFPEHMEGEAESGRFGHYEDELQGGRSVAAKFYIKADKGVR